MSVDALSFTINGYHEKAERSVDPLRHWLMLLASIDLANPKGEHPIIIAANNLDIWALPQKERSLVWEVHKRATIVTCRNKSDGHFTGACWAPRMATEAAAAIGADRLLFLAEDILLNQPATAILDEMGDDDYIGSGWGDDHSLSVQMFGCRVRSFANLQTGRFVFDPPFNIAGEWLLFQRLMDLGIPWKRIKIEERCLHYYHNHDPDTFLSCAKERGASIPMIEDIQSLEMDAGFYWYDRVGFGGREMELRKDGSVGVGAGGGEATWSIRQRGDERRLSIFDIHDELLCELIQMPHGLWRGRWNRHERMEIILGKVNK